MSSLRILMAIFILILSNNILSAQASADKSSSFIAKGITLTEAEDQDWSIYNDEENKTYYIDFEKITFNLSEIMVFNSQNEVVFKEEVFDLPVNTIYELDFNGYESGDYRIELRSFTKYIRKDVAVK